MVFANCSDVSNTPVVAAVLVAPAAKSASHCICMHCKKPTLQQLSQQPKPKFAYTYSFLVKRSLCTVLNPAVGHCKRNEPMCISGGAGECPKVVNLYTAYMA